MKTKRFKSKTVGHAEEAGRRAAQMPQSEETPQIHRSQEVHAIARYLSGEWRQFKSLNENCRVLIISNFVYSFVFLILPIIANYAISQVVQDIKFNVAYFTGYFFSIPVGFALNGYLLRFFRVNRLYIAGMLAEVFVIVPLFFMRLHTIPQLAGVGFVMGISSGLFWSNRHYISISVTTNENRNYVLGLENALMNLAGIFSPLVFGFLTGAQGLTLCNLGIGFTQAHGNVLFAGFLLSLILIASANILRGCFKQPQLNRFLYLRYCSTWNRQRIINLLEGMTQGPLIVIPSLVVLHIFKDSGVLGLLDSIGIAVALLPIYFLGRYTRPRHRVAIIVGGASILLVGAATIAVSFSQVPTISFMLCAKIVFTLLFMPYLAIRMRSIELSDVIDKRNEYAYFIDIEAFLNLGRVFGMSVFLAVYFLASQVYALRFGFLVIVLFTLTSAIFARRIQQE